MHLFKCLTLWVTAARVQHNGISLEIDGTDSMEQFRDLNELNSVRPVRCCIIWFIWFYISLYSRYGSVLVEILGAAIESTEQVCVCVGHAFNAACRDVVILCVTCASSPTTFDELDCFLSLLALCCRPISYLYYKFFEHDSNAADNRIFEWNWKSDSLISNAQPFCQRRRRRRRWFIIILRITAQRISLPLVVARRRRLAAGVRSGRLSL